MLTDSNFFHHRIRVKATVLALLIAACTSVLASNYQALPVEFDRVRLADDFWLPRLRIQRQVLVPYAFRRTAEALEDLRVAGLVLKGEHPASLPAPHRYRTSDLFKVIEGAAYLLAIEPDSALESQLDGMVATIAAAQEQDGYLNATRTLYPRLAIEMMGDSRYSYVDHSHELYIVGHLYEAAVAYYHATGNRTLLDVADKNARHVRHVFFEGDPAYNKGKPINQAPGHEEIELALVRLAEATGDALHLDTAKRFLDIRGVTYRPQGEGVFSPTYAQQHQAVAKQTEPVGHAVRATYLYAGMADVGAKLGANDYDQALDAIWKNIVDTRMHITGGLGAVHGIEGFGKPYELPNSDAFNETCAAVGNVLFNWRMYLLHDDAKYLDVAEVALFNNVLAGMNLEGNRFFYVNPLATDGQRPFNHGSALRSPWFGTACCPTNLARLIPQIPGMLFAQDGEELSVCLFASCSTELEIAGTTVDVQEVADYPFDGNIELTFDPKTPVQFAVRLRIPTWTTDRLVPGELYQYQATEDSQAVTISVNGKEIDYQIERGFATVLREWESGDKLTLQLPMPVRFSSCRDEVETNRGRVAVTRGPLVYCAEEVDNGENVSRFMIKPEKAISKASIQKLALDAHLTRSVSIDAARLDSDRAVHPAKLTLVPYYAWNNRGQGSMAVWIPGNEATLRSSAIIPDDNSKRFAEVTATHTFEGDSTQAMVDGRFPRNSFDTSIPRWTSWPERGKPQVAEFTLSEPLNLRSVEVYWYDDHGGVQLPERWSLEYEQEGRWHSFPLYNTDSYSVLADQFNVVHPAAPLTTGKLRLQVWPREDAAAGVLEFVVRPETN